MANTTPTTPTPSIWDFLREIVSRLGQKNPKIFTYLAWIGTAAAAVTQLPEFLASIEGLGIVLPAWIAAIQSKLVFGAGLAIIFVSNLTVKRDPVVVTDEKVVTEASVEKLPFTVKAEVAEAQKEADKIS